MATQCAKTSSTVPAPHCDQETVRGRTAPAGAEARTPCVARHATPSSSAHCCARASARSRPSATTAPTASARRWSASACTVYDGGAARLRAVPAAARAEAARARSSCATRARPRGARGVTRAPRACGRCAAARRRLRAADGSRHRHQSTIARPREEVFAYLADVANHPEFTDHFLVDWHLTREDTVRRAAPARASASRRRSTASPGRDLDAHRGRARPAGSSSAGAAASTTASARSASTSSSRRPAARRGSTYTLETRAGLLSRPPHGDVRRPGLVQAQVGRALRRLRSILEEDARPRRAGHDRRPLRIRSAPRCPARMTPLALLAALAPFRAASRRLRQQAGDRDPTARPRAPTSTSAARLPGPDLAPAQPERPRGPRLPHRPARGQDRSLRATRCGSRSSSRVENNERAGRAAPRTTSRSSTRSGNVYDAGPASARTNLFAYRAGAVADAARSCPSPTRPQRQLGPIQRHDGALQGQARRASTTARSSCDPHARRAGEPARSSVDRPRRLAAAAARCSAGCETTAAARAGRRGRRRPRRRRTSRTPTATRGRLRRARRRRTRRRCRSGRRRGCGVDVAGLVGSGSRACPASSAVPVLPATFDAGDRRGVPVP